MENEYHSGRCTESAIQKDGSLHFILEIRDGHMAKFMECAVKYEDGQFVVLANDHEVARF